MPSGKVRYAKLSSANGGQINSQKETSPAKESLKPKRCPEPTEAARAVPSMTFRILITSPHPSQRSHRV
ncbi:hypothetical protein R6Z07M_008896 [Ovis aries]